ncbi:NAD(P)H-dependent glycerol-3-phosphate dehydrogenase [Metamycoplasma gateae]|uniref:Glycerol-3-phosphate dehydrogenase n=1 Tax=Metamycoplasma gateae TaxID=35769 RepID=A0ABZ2AN65_9BACT|nr:NAD(P)H-dependent glycerol-3-phosphate dehydrogenase [Metamycoplasma gateae]
MINKIAILGSGAMGTACGNILLENNHDVIFYGINDNELNDLKNGFNKKYFSNPLFGKFKTTKNLEKAVVDANFIIIAIPSKFIPDVFEKLLNLINKKTIIINVAKGFWPNTNDFIHSKMEKLSSNNKYVIDIVSLLGPSFAIDIINKNITIVNAISKNLVSANKVKKIFSNDWFGVSTNNDVIGAEIGSSFKNILAIASGMMEGLGYSTNTQAALLTFGLKEMKKYAMFLNANVETVYDLCGVGDLILTALSEKSRNYRYGKMFFKNKIDDNLVTVEGLYSLKHVYNQIKKENKKIKLPLIEAIYNLVYNKDNPKKIIKNLMKKI